MYNSKWSEFEVQSLAFGILRKNLYPNYLVRGEYKMEKARFDIAIFKAHKEKEPELKCVLEVKKSKYGTSEAQGNRYTAISGVPTIYIRGGDDAYKVMDLVRDFL